MSASSSSALAPERQPLRPPGRAGLASTAGAVLLWLLSCAKPAWAGDFWYVDFNETAGLRFNGVATTSSCGDNTGYEYNVLHGLNDASERGSKPPVMVEGTATTSETTVFTGDEQDTVDTQVYRALFPNRDGAATAPTTCPVRLR
jgi:hypothetical protein